MILISVLNYKNTSYIRAHDNSVGTMAPLDLDKYAEIAKQCKYLPENDLKVNMTLYIYF